MSRCQVQKEVLATLPPTYSIHIPLVILSASEGSHAWGNEILRFAQNDNCSMSPELERSSGGMRFFASLRMTTVGEG
jgi:hypothetical protein